MLDGVFARTTAGALRFHAEPVPSAADMADILSAIVPAVRRLLARHGLDGEDGTAADPFPEATPLLAGWAAASVRGPRRRAFLAGLPIPERVQSRLRQLDEPSRRR